MYRFLFAISGSFCLALLLSCSDNSTSPEKPVTQKPSAQASSQPVKSTAPSEQDLVARGRSVYMSNCIACHNPDPTKDGAIGPANAGSSEALLEAKVIHNTYPPGYKPKRDSNAMIALPHLAKEIPALHAYLNSMTP